MASHQPLGDDAFSTSDTMDSLQISCMGSEDDILIKESDGCLSEEEVDVITPPRGKGIEDQKNVVRHLRKLAESSPKVYGNIMKKNNQLDKQLNEILQHDSTDRRDLQCSRSSFGSRKSEPRDAPPSDNPEETKAALRAILSPSQDEQQREATNVTVVDYPSLGMVEVFSPLKDSGSAAADSVPSPKASKSFASNKTTGSIKPTKSVPVSEPPKAPDAIGIIGSSRSHLDVISPPAHTVAPADPLEDIEKKLSLPPVISSLSKGSLGNPPKLSVDTSPHQDSDEETTDDELSPKSPILFEPPRTLRSHRAASPVPNLEKTLSSEPSSSDSDQIDQQFSEESIESDSGSFDSDDDEASGPRAPPSRSLRKDSSLSSANPAPIEQSPFKNTEESKINKSMTEKSTRSDKSVASVNESPSPQDIPAVESTVKSTVPPTQSKQEKQSGSKSPLKQALGFFGNKMALASEASGSNATEQQSMQNEESSNKFSEARSAVDAQDTPQEDAETAKVPASTESTALDVKVQNAKKRSSPGRFLGFFGKDSRKASHRSDKKVTEAVVVDKVGPYTAEANGTEVENTAFDVAITVASMVEVELKGHTDDEPVEPTKIIEEKASQTQKIESGLPPKPTKKASSVSKTKKDKVSKANTRKAKKKKSKSKPSPIIAINYKDSKEIEVVGKIIGKSFDGKGMVATPKASGPVPVSDQPTLTGVQSATPKTKACIAEAEKSISNRKEEIKIASQAQSDQQGAASKKKESRFRLGGWGRLGKKTTQDKAKSAMPQAQAVEFPLETDTRPEAIAEDEPKEMSSKPVADEDPYVAVASVHDHESELASKEESPTKPSVQEANIDVQADENSTAVLRVDTQDDLGSSAPRLESPKKSIGAAIADFVDWISPKGAQSPKSTTSQSQAEDAENFFSSDIIGACMSPTNNSEIGRTGFDETDDTTTVSIIDSRLSNKDQCAAMLSVQTEPPVVNESQPEDSTPKKKSLGASLKAMVSPRRSNLDRTLTPKTDEASNGVQVLDVSAKAKESIATQDEKATTTQTAEVSTNTLPPRPNAPPTKSFGSTFKGWVSPKSKDPVGITTPRSKAIVEEATNILTIEDHDVEENPNAVPPLTVNSKEEPKKQATTNESSSKTPKKSLGSALKGWLSPKAKQFSKAQMLAEEATNESTANKTGRIHATSEGPEQVAAATTPSNKSKETQSQTTPAKNPTRSKKKFGISLNSTRKQQKGTPRAQACIEEATGEETLQTKASLTVQTDAEPTLTSTLVDLIMTPRSETGENVEGSQQGEDALAQWVSQASTLAAWVTSPDGFGCGEDANPQSPNETTDQHDSSAVGQVSSTHDEDDSSLLADEETPEVPTVPKELNPVQEDKETRKEPSDKKTTRKSHFTKALRLGRSSKASSKAQQPFESTEKETLVSDTEATNLDSKPAGTSTLADQKVLSKQNDDAAAPQNKAKAEPKVAEPKSNDESKATKRHKSKKKTQAIKKGTPKTDEVVSTGDATKIVPVASFARVDEPKDDTTKTALVEASRKGLTDETPKMVEEANRKEPSTQQGSCLPTDQEQQSNLKASKKTVNVTKKETVPVDSKARKLKKKKNKKDKSKSLKKAKKTKEVEAVTKKFESGSSTTTKTASPVEPAASKQEQDLPTEDRADVKPKKDEATQQANVKSKAPAAIPPIAPKKTSKKEKKSKLKTKARAKRAAVKEAKLSLSMSIDDNAATENKTTTDSVPQIKPVAPLSPRNKKESPKTERAKAKKSSTDDKIKEPSPAPIGVGKVPKSRVRAISDEMFSKLDAGTPESRTSRTSAGKTTPNQSSRADRMASRRKRIAVLVGESEDQDDSSRASSHSSGNNSVKHWWRRTVDRKTVPPTPESAASSVKEYEKHMGVCAVSDLSFQEKDKPATPILSPSRKDSPLKRTTPRMRKAGKPPLAATSAQPKKSKATTGTTKKFSPKQPEKELEGFDNFDTFDDDLSNVFAPDISPNESKEWKWMW